MKGTARAGAALLLTLPALTLSCYESRTVIASHDGDTAADIDAPDVDAPIDVGGRDDGSGPSGPVILRWSWTIEGHSYTDIGAFAFEVLCSWSNWWEPAEELTIRLMVDFDTLEDHIYDAPCQWGTAETDPETDPADYTPGQVIWFAFQMIDYEGYVVALSADYIKPDTPDEWYGTDPPFYED